MVDGKPCCVGERIHVSGVACVVGQQHRPRWPAVRLRGGRCLVDGGARRHPRGHRDVHEDGPQAGPDDGLGDGERAQRARPARESHVAAAGPRGPAPERWSRKRPRRRSALPRGARTPTRTRHLGPVGDPAGGQGTRRSGPCGGCDVPVREGDPGEGLLPGGLAGHVRRRLRGQRSGARARSLGKCFARARKPDQHQPPAWACIDEMNAAGSGLLLSRRIRADGARTSSLAGHYSTKPPAGWRVRGSTIERVQIAHLEETANQM